MSAFITMAEPLLSTIIFFIFNNLAEEVSINATLIPKDARLIAI